jgi:hypothetical protein
MHLLLALLIAAAPTPADEHRAVEVAARLHHVVRASARLRDELRRIGDKSLRKAVLDHLTAPGLPGNSWALGHLAETEAALKAAGLLTGSLPPLAGAGSFWAAPAGPCPDGHHAYPGGLPVHTLANLLHAQALAGIYRKVYGVESNSDWLKAAAAWHDSAKALTLRWSAGGDCGHEPAIAGTAAHHVLGIAAAISEKLPGRLIFIIASAHVAPSAENLSKICNWLKAGSIMATGKPDAVVCPEAREVPLEAFINNSSDSDYALTGAASAGAVGDGEGGWKRFDRLLNASELQIRRDSAKAPLTQDDYP